MTITAKFQSRCLGCGEQIQAGERIEWEKGVGTSHADCASPSEVAASRKWAAEATTEALVKMEAGYHGALEAGAEENVEGSDLRKVDQLRLVLVAEITRRANAKVVRADGEVIAEVGPEYRTGKPEACEPGVYERDGEIYVVKPNREKTRVYAKRLVEIALSTPRVLEDGTEVNYDIEFEYAKGAIYDLSESDRMDTARAEELAIRYGRCINCGRSLKTAESVKRGIGPVCMKRFKAVA